MRELTSREIAAVKRQYDNSKPAFDKIQSIEKKIEELNKEKELQWTILNGGETGIIALTGGYRSIDLITVTYEPLFNEDGTPKMDKEGKYQQKKKVKTFNYPVEVVEETPEVEELPNTVEMTEVTNDNIEL